jgi:hypothetical protein
MVFGTVSMFRGAARMSTNDDDLKVAYVMKGSEEVTRYGDLVFSDGVPILVVAWRETRGIRVPQATIRLDKEHLRKSEGSLGIYEYDVPLSES